MLDKYVVINELEIIRQNNFLFLFETYLIVSNSFTHVISVKLRKTNGYIGVTDFYT